MAIRPLLHRGDLVKLTKRYSNENDKMYRVLRWESSALERKKLHIHKPDTRNGFVNIKVVDAQGETYTFKRRQLWRVPNQPRDKKNPAHTTNFAGNKINLPGYKSSSLKEQADLRRSLHQEMIVRSRMEATEGLERFKNVYNKVKS